MSFDGRRFSTLDRVVAAGAAVVFIALFLPWWGIDIEGFSYSVDGWSAGFTAWAGGLLLTIAGVLVVLRRSGANLTTGNIGPSLLVAGIAALGLLLVIIRWVSLPRYRGLGVGARYGLYIALIAGIAEVVAAVLAMRASGEALPFAQTQSIATPAEPDPPSPETPATPEE